MNSSFFDNFAQTYDEKFTNTRIGKMQRQRVYHFLKEYIEVDKHMQILEVNCGTGVDAIYMGNQGHNIIATDASEEMISIARKKNTINNITFLKYSFNELTDHFHQLNFDFIFSNFGGINCINEPELKKTIEQFGLLLNKNGKLFIVAMGTRCIWESLYFILKAKLKEAFRRWGKKPAEVTIESSKLETYYHKPKKIKKFAEINGLICAKKRPIGLFIPPSYLEPFFQSKLSILNLLNQLERLFSWSAFANLADHYMVVFTKK